MVISRIAVDAAIVVLMEASREEVARAKVAEERFPRLRVNDPRLVVMVNVSGLMETL